MSANTRTRAPARASCTTRLKSSGEAGEPGDAGAPACAALPRAVPPSAPGAIARHAGSLTVLLRPYARTSGGCRPCHVRPPLARRGALAARAAAFARWQRSLSIMQLATVLGPAKA